MAEAQQNIHQDCAAFRVVTWDKRQFYLHSPSHETVLTRVETTKWNNPTDIRPVDFCDQTLHPVLRTDSHVVVMYVATSSCVIDC